MTKIFKVWMATYAVVAAEDEANAYEVASRNARSVFADAGAPHIDVMGEAKTLQDLDYGWDGGCLPYGGDGKTPLSKLLPPNAQSKPRRRRSA